MSDDQQSHDLDFILRRLTASAYRAYSLCLCGNPTPNQRDYYDRVTKPRVGDMILEITNWKARAIDRIGVLVSADQEPPPDMSQDDYDEAEWGRPWPPYLEKVWRIITTDDRPFHWTNANFIAVPKGPFGFDKRPA